LLETGPLSTSSKPKIGQGRLLIFLLFGWLWIFAATRYFFAVTRIPAMFGGSGIVYLYRYFLLFRYLLTR